MNWPAERRRPGENQALPGRFCAGRGRLLETMGANGRIQRGTTDAGTTVVDARRCIRTPG
jgi:hypothetical protein